MAATYKLVFSGEVAEGRTREQVQSALAALFKKPVEEIAALFEGGPRVLKEAARADDLGPFRKAMAKAGAVARVEGPADLHADVETRATDRPEAAVSQAGQAAPARYSISEFVKRTSERERGQGVFELEHERMLEVNLNGLVWLKTGAMIAYNGDIKFTREALLERGLGKLLKQSVTGEGARLTKAEGGGKLYLADVGKKITILNLSDEAIVVNGNDILAFEAVIDFDVRMMKKVSAMLAGGLFNVRLAGTGMIAITTHYDPLTLAVTPGKPVYSDPNATVAWSDSLEPSFKTDVSFKTFLGRGSGESVQMQFEGNGFVVVQPYEEAYLQASR